jgi:hypothetical protein
MQPETPVHTIPAWNSAGRKSSRFQLFTRYRQIIFHFDNMLHKSVKIDRIKYPTTTFAVPLIHIIRETILLQYLLINHIDGKNFAEANLWSLACTNTCK